MDRDPGQSYDKPLGSITDTRFLELSHQILSLAGQNQPRIELLKDVSRMIGHFSDCDAVEFCVEQFETQYYWKATFDPKSSHTYKLMPRLSCDIGDMLSTFNPDPDQPGFCVSLLIKHLDPALPFVTANGSLWVKDVNEFIKDDLKSLPDCNIDFHLGDGYRTILLIPFEISSENFGILQLKSRKRDHFTESEVLSLENIAQIWGLIAAYRRMRIECGERVKELTCLYGIARIAGHDDKPLEDILGEIINLIPPAMQFPEITMVKILLDENEFMLNEFSSSRYSINAKLLIKNRDRGSIEVAYKDDGQTFVSDPFLKEEQSLLNTLAREISLVIEERESSDYEAKLQAQLLHADRLATIGQLAAGIAHEINEPLGSILGYSELIKKEKDLDPQVNKDLTKIINASIHAREIVKKLLLFSKQVPTQANDIDLNEIVQDGIYFLESRIKKEGIELKIELASNMPHTSGDRTQIHQVLINLAVNAIQAMPDGGKLAIKTAAFNKEVCLIVEDNGSGMDPDTVKQIFLPFYTTKDVGEGTGLGLSVVHGIVTSHGGRIYVDSTIGRGTKFEVRLPINESLGDIEKDD